MTPAKRRFVLRGLVAVNLLALAMSVLSGRWWGGLIGSVVMSIGAAQWLLLPIWAVLGTSRLRVRVVGSAIGCVLVALCMSALVSLMYGTVAHYRNVLEGAVFYAEIGFLRALVVAAALVVMWLDGLCLVCFRGPIEPCRSAWPQFSLKHLFFAIAIVGMVLGGGNLTRTFPTVFQAGGQWLPIVLEMLGLALLTCVMVRATLSPAPPAARVVLALLLAVLLGLARAYYLHTEAAFALGFAIGAFLVASWLAGSLLLVRACGYRAMRPADWSWAAAFADQIERRPNSESA